MTVILIYFLRKTGKYEEQLGTATPVDLANPSKLILTYQFGPIIISYDYWIIDTDYSLYSLVYSCRVTLGRKNEFAWILSRQRNLDPARVNALKNKLQSYGVNANLFIVSDQSGC
jgi:apolipoprotein D and lipocalin family protein